MKFLPKLLSVLLIFLALSSNFLFVNKNYLTALDISFIGFVLNYFLIILKYKSINIFLILRVICLTIPGFVATLAWVIDEKIYRGHYLAFFIQTPYVTTFISIASLYCLIINSFFIYKFGGNDLIFNFYKIKDFFKKRSIIISYAKARYAALFSIIFGVFLTAQKGFKLINQGYNPMTEIKYFSTPIDNVQAVLHNICVSIVISHVLIGIKDKRADRLLNLCLIGYSLPILTGSRCDYVVGLLTILVLKISRTKFFKNLMQSTKGNATIFLTIFISSFTSYLLAIFLKFISIYRASNYGFFESIKRINLLIIEREGYKVINLDTITHVLGSFYSFGYKVLEQGQNYLYGKSYIEYFFRLIPSSLRQGIPLKYQLEWQTDILGNSVTAGGNLEIAEAFFNFGLLGVIFISLLTTLLIIYIAKRSIKNLSFMILFFTISFESFRYIWYGYFALFKLISVFVIFYPFINYLSPKIIKKLN